MGGSAVGDDCEVTTNAARTLVLLGRTRNGKSATGNSILGKKEFKSKSSSNGVTSISELKSTRLENGLMIDVIDTPGLFDFSGEPEYIGKEIVKCMELAMNGTMLFFWFCLCEPGSLEKNMPPSRAFRSSSAKKIRDYMIVVFTGGDELEENDESLDYYLGNDCPEPLKETIKMCDKRVVLFDNKNKDPKKKVDQLNKLLSLVTQVLEKNDGVPYTNELFKQLKVILKMTDITYKYLEQWATERADKLAAEKIFKAAQAKSEDEVRELRENLERAKLVSEKRANRGCYIL